MTIYAPWVLDENDTVPYVTIQDIKNSAIAASLDFTNLVLTQVSTLKTQL